MKWLTMVQREPSGKLDNVVFFRMPWCEFNIKADLLKKSNLEIAEGLLCYYVKLLLHGIN